MVAKATKTVINVMFTNIKCIDYIVTGAGLQYAQLFMYKYVLDLIGALMNHVTRHISNRRTTATVCVRTVFCTLRSEKEEIIITMQ